MLTWPALSGRGGTPTGPGTGTRWAVGDRRAADPAAAAAPAGRRQPVRRGPGGVHRDRLRLRAGCAWPPLPAQLGVSTATAHRRFATWTEVGAVAPAAPGSP